MTAIILAGGKATRMKGHDKAFLKINHEPLIKRQIKLLGKLFSRQAILNEGGILPEAGKEIIIVTNSSKKYKSLKGVRVITDLVPHQGPLGGIYSGLMASSSFYNFVVACDMPYIDSVFIEYMYNKSSGYDAVVPILNKRYEPLYSFYSKNCLNPIGQLLDKKMLKINKLFSEIRVKKITEDQVGRFALGAKIFTNINTRKDLADLYADR